MQHWPDFGDLKPDSDKEIDAIKYRVVYEDDTWEWVTTPRRFRLPVCVAHLQISHRKRQATLLELDIP